MEGERGEEEEREVERDGWWERGERRREGVCVHCCCQGLASEGLWVSQL